KSKAECERYQGSRTPGSRQEPGPRRNGIGSDWILMCHFARSHVIKRKGAALGVIRDKGFGLCYSLSRAIESVFCAPLRIGCRRLRHVQETSGQAASASWRS